MVKAHKRKNRHSMRRTSRVYLTHANVGKVAALRASLLLYVNVVNLTTGQKFDNFAPDSNIEALEVGH